MTPQRSPEGHDDIVPPQEPSGTLRGDLVNVARGFCMGAADTVPGVSGGTVALILGHYTRLISAISHIDGEMVSLTKSRKWAQLLSHVDARFLVALAVGMVIGIGSLSQLMHYLFDHHRPETLAVFLGFLVASVWIVRNYVSRWSPSRWIALVVGMVVAVGITLIPMSQAEPAHGYLFVAGSVAICAMILPGISGAFVLVLFGVYHAVTGMIKETVKLNLTWDAISRLIVFALGCLVGLLAFSKLLRYLLAKHHDVTMAALVGLMVGSIRKLYPLQRVTPETADLDRKMQVTEYVSFADWPESLWPLAALAIVACIVILVVESFFGTPAEETDTATG